MTPQLKISPYLIWAFVADEVVAIYALSVDLDSLSAANLACEGAKGTLEAH